jgi:transcriptional regulator with XRE-family HTH domain
MNMEHVDKLRQIFEQKGLSFTELGKMIGKSSPTIKKKLYSENVTTVIDFILALDVRLIDENGIDIITGEKAFSEPKPEPEKVKEKERFEGMIQIGNVLFDKNDLEKLKMLLDNL